MLKKLLPLAAGLILALALVVSGTPAANTAPPPRRSSSAITITPDGRRLLVVNPDSNSLTLVDTSLARAITEVPVGVDPRTVAVDDAGQYAYVANRGSDSLTQIDLDHPWLTRTLLLGDRPYGVVVSPDGTRIYVAEQGSSRVVVIAANPLKALRSYPVPNRPSGLAISDDGRTLYVTHLLSGQVSLIALDSRQISLPLVLSNARAGKSTRAPALSPGAAAPAAGEELYPVTTFALFPDSNLAQSVVLSPDRRTAYLPHTRSNTANPALTFDTTVFPLVSLFDLQTPGHLLGQQLDLGVLDPPGVGLPFDAAFTPDGRQLWVVNAASNDLSVLDLDGRRLAAHIEVGDNPRGIVISPDGATAYVNNTLAGTVSVIDAHSYSVTATIPVTRLPLPPALLNGKRLFHSSNDPRLSLNQWIACNTCHFDGEHDGRTWTFGFAGPRNTTSLLGMIETYPLRWSGEWDESADSEFANRKENFGSGLLAGDMSCTLSPPDCTGLPLHQGHSYDLDSLALFIDSLPVPYSPAHAAGQPLTPAEQRGKAIFNTPALGCVACHPAPFYTDLLLHDVGTATAGERIGPAYDTPSLRGLYTSAPYFHDGSAATLLDALTRPSPGSEHDLSATLTSAQLQDLIAFLLALPYPEYLDFPNPYP